MKKVVLHQPSVEELEFRQKLLADEKTMIYNAGYDLNFEVYHYDTGCIDFPKSEWNNFETKIFQPNFFYAYIKDIEKNIFVGEINFNINKNTKIASMGIVIKDEFRGQGYMRPAVNLLFIEAKKRKVKSLSDTVPKSREIALKVFLDLGFKITKEFTGKKFGKDEIIFEIQKEIK